VKRTERQRAALAVLLAIAVPLAFAASAISHHGLTSLIGRGAQGTAEPFFSGTHIYQRRDTGHDGAQFYVIARTFPHITRAVPYLDHPAYRLRRILFPAITSTFGAGRSYALGVLLMNLLCAGACAAALLRMARKADLPWWAAVGLAFSPAVLLATQLSIGDVCALALGLWALALEERPWAPVLLCALAGFTRETALIAAGVLLLQTRRARYLLPIAAVGAWMLYLQHNYSFGPLPIAAPFSAWFNSQGAVIALLAIGEAWGAWKIRKHLPMLAWWGFAEVLTLIFVSSALTFSGNFARAVPLATTLMTMGLAAEKDHIQQREDGHHQRLKAVGS
jgi:hypothetical protein